MQSKHHWQADKGIQCKLAFASDSDWTMYRSTSNLILNCLPQYQLEWPAISARIEAISGNKLEIAFIKSKQKVSTTCWVRVCGVTYRVDQIEAIKQHRNQTFSQGHECLKVWCVGKLVNCVMFDTLVNSNGRNFLKAFKVSVSTWQQSKRD